MDPYEALKRFDEAMEDGDREDVAEYADSLIGWLDKGGFMPFREDGGDWRRLLTRSQFLYFLVDIRKVANMLSEEDRE